MKLHKKIFDNQINEDEAKKKILVSISKPIGVVGLILIYGGIAFVTLSKTQFKEEIFIILFIIGIMLSNFDILNRIFNKKFDEIDLFIAKFMLFGVIMIFLGIIAIVVIKVFILT